MSSYFWTKEVTHALIEEYRARTCLWKTKSKDYLNRTIRARAYDELLFFLKSADERLSDLTLTDLKKKIDGLRTTFRREYTKVITSQQSGLPDDYIYKPTLWYYSMMTFLIDGDSGPMVFPSSDGAPSSEQKIEEKDIVDISYEAIKLEKIDEIEEINDEEVSKSTQVEQAEINNLTQYYYQQNEKEINIPCGISTRHSHLSQTSSDAQHFMNTKFNHLIEEERSSLDFETYVHQNNQDASSSRKPIKRKSTMDDVYFLAEKQLRMFDDCEAVFGQNVAINLRKITNSTQRIICEKLINDALYQARLGVLTVNSFITAREDCAIQK